MRSRSKTLPNKALNIIKGIFEINKIELFLLIKFELFILEKVYQLSRSVYLVQEILLEIQAFHTEIKCKRIVQISSFSKLILEQEGKILFFNLNFIITLVMFHV